MLKSGQLARRCRLSHCFSAAVGIRSLADHVRYGSLAEIVEASRPTVCLATAPRSVAPGWVYEARSYRFLRIAWIVSPYRVTNEVGAFHFSRKLSHLGNQGIAKGVWVLMASVHISPMSTGGKL